MPKLIRKKAVYRSALFCVLGLVLAGCASSGGGGGVLDKTLEAVGLGKPAAPSVPSMSDLPADMVRMPAMNKQITLRLHAGEALNVDANGRSLSLVARIYKLKNASAFLQAPYSMFTDAQMEKKMIGDDVVELREIVMTPGKKYEVIETMPVTATHLAIVALFRSPDPQRWKFVFEGRSAVRTGLTLGMHDCALSVAEGEPIDVPLEVRRLAGMQCPSP